MSAEDARKRMEDIYNSMHSEEEEYTSELTEALSYLALGNGRKMIQDLSNKKYSGIPINMQLKLSDDLLLDLESLVIVYKPSDEVTNLDEKIYKVDRCEIPQSGDTPSYRKLGTLPKGNFRDSNRTINYKLEFVEIMPHDHTVTSGSLYKIPAYLVEIFKQEEISIEDFYEKISKHIIEQKRIKRRSMEDYL